MAFESIPGTEDDETIFVEYEKRKIIQRRKTNQCYYTKNNRTPKVWSKYYKTIHEND